MKQAKTCTHIKTNGVVCGSPALRDNELCYFHHQQKERATLRVRIGFPFDPSIHIESLEDLASVNLAFTEVIHAILDRRIDNARARMILYALSCVSNNLKHNSDDPGPELLATELPEDGAPLVRSVPESEKLEYKQDWPCPPEQPEPRRKPSSAPRAESRAQASPVADLDTFLANFAHNRKLPKSSPLPSLSQVQTDIDAAKSGDLNAAKRLLAQLK